MPETSVDIRRRKRRGKTAARGYGASHQLTRLVVDRLVQAGLAKCARCTLPIAPGSKWHLDHSDDRSRYLGPSHARCNLEAAGRKTSGRRSRRVSVAL